MRMNSENQSDDSDSIPVKENHGSPNNVVGSSSNRLANNNNNNNPRIVRDEFEDRYLHMADENLTLKKQLRSHEDKIKQLATKLMRLAGEKNSKEKRNDTELEDQKGKIVELEGQINMLRDQLIVSKVEQRVNGTGPFMKVGGNTNGPGPSSKPKVKPMKPKATGVLSRSSLLSSNFRVSGASSRTSVTGGVQSSNKITSNTSRSSLRSANSSIQSDGAIIVHDHVTQLLFEAKGENHALRDQVKRLRDELTAADKEIASCKQQLEFKEIEQDDALISLRHQIELELDSKQQKMADMQLIRLQRDSRRTANWLAAAETKCQSLESNLSSANETILNLESQVVDIQAELREEQTKNLNLMKQVEEASSTVHRVKEIETQLKALQDDNQILKEANESLVAKAFDSGNRVKIVESQDNSLKQQITQLETTIRGELQAKSELLSSLNQEKTKCSTLQQELDILNKNCSSLASQLKETEHNLVESETKVRTQAPLPEDCSKCLAFEAQLNQTKWEWLQSKDELSKTKHLLKTQISINKEYQKEIEVLNTKLEKAESFHHEKLHDFMKVLEQRTEQMSVLERSLESISSMRSNTPTTASAPPSINETPQQQPQALKLDDSVRVNSTKLVTPSGPQVQNEPNSQERPPYFIRAETPPPEPQEPDPAKMMIATTEETSRTPKPTHEPEIVQPMAEGIEKNEPSLEIYIDKFEPFNKELLAGLFVTWEFEPFDRKYSPVVSNGFFNTISSHSFSNKRFPIDGIEIQVHQAIGTSDCITLASGSLHIGSNLTSPIYSALPNDKDSLLGHLYYSCSIENFDGENNNIYEQRKPIVDQNEQSAPLQMNPQLPQSTSLSQPWPTPSERNQSRPTDLEKPQETDDKYKSPKKLDSDSAANPAIKSTSPKKNPTVQEQKRNQAEFESSRNDEREIIEEPYLIEALPDRENESGAQPLPLSNLIKSSGRNNSQLIMVSEEDEDDDDTISQSTTTATVNKRRQRNPAAPAPKGKARAISAQQLENQPTFIQNRHTKNNDKQANDDSDSETSKNITELDSSTSSSTTTLHDEAEFEVPIGTIRIEISSVSFNSTNRFWSDSRFKRFFVEYRFLNYPQEELETPTSLPIPQPGRPAQFDFLKIFVIDSLEKCKLLRQMLKKHVKLRFTLVSEPNEDDSLDCEDMGYGQITLNDILKNEADLLEEEIPLYDSENSKIQIGVICVSITALELLKSI